MTRYINKDGFIAQIRDNFCTECNNYDGVKCKSCGIDDTIEMVENADEADIVPKSEVEVWKQNRFNLYQKLECYKMARQKVAREIIKDLKELLQPYETEFKRGNVTIENLHCYPTYKGYSIPKYEVDAFIAELKKKYTENENG